MDFKSSDPMIIVRRQTLGKRKRRGIAVVGAGPRRALPALPGRRRGRNQRTAGFLGIELKFYDQALVAAALTAPTDASAGEQDPSATVLLNTVTQGDGESQRDGRKMVMKSISLNGVVRVGAQNDQSVLDNAPLIFIALVLDTQTNGATISSENVYCNQGANAILAASPYRNLQFSRRFKVLRSLQFAFPTPNAADVGANIEISGHFVPWRMDVKLNDIPVTFSGTTETVANITDNSLHLIAYAAGISAAPLLSYNSRLRFVG